MNEQAVADKLIEIAAKNGGVLTPDAVINEAKKKTSVLHGEFEWDDTVAAKKYRIDQARRIIRTVKYPVETEYGIKRSIRYIQDPMLDEKVQGYRDIVEVRDDSAMARASMALEFKNAKSYLYRALNVAEVLGMSADVEKIVAALDSLTEKLKAA